MDKITAEIKGIAYSPDLCRNLNEFGMDESGC